MVVLGVVAVSHEQGTPVVPSGTRPSLKGTHLAAVVVSISNKRAFSEKSCTAGRERERERERGSGWPLIIAPAPAAE